MIESCVDYSTRAVPIVPFVDASFNELGCSSIFDLNLMSFCTQGLPGVAEPTFSISGGKPFNQMDSFSKLSTNPMDMDQD